MKINRLFTLEFPRPSLLSAFSWDYSRLNLHQRGSRCDLSGDNPKNSFSVLWEHSRRLIRINLGIALFKKNTHIRNRDGNARPNLAWWFSSYREKISNFSSPQRWSHIAHRPHRVCEVKIFYFVWAINCQIDYKYSSADFLWCENCQLIWKQTINVCAHLYSVSHEMCVEYIFFSYSKRCDVISRVGVEVDLVMLMMALMTWWLDEALMVNLKSLTIKIILHYSSGLYERINQTYPLHKLTFDSLHLSSSRRHIIALHNLARATTFRI